jgi:hypothetical protein
MDLREDEMVWIGLLWLRIGTSGGLSWTRYWIFGFHKCWEVLEWLHNWRLLKNGSAPWVSKYMEGVQSHCDFSYCCLRLGSGKRQS